MGASLGSTLRAMESTPGSVLAVGELGVDLVAGPAGAVAAGSPPWMTKLGSMRWKVRPS